MEGENREGGDEDRRGVEGDREVVEGVRAVGAEDVQREVKQERDSGRRWIWRGSRRCARRRRPARGEAAEGLREGDRSYAGGGDGGWRSLREEDDRRWGWSWRWR